jgi:hypothetical protein
MCVIVFIINVVVFGGNVVVVSEINAVGVPSASVVDVYASIIRKNLP